MYIYIRLYIPRPPPRWSARFLDEELRHVKFSYRVEGARTLLARKTFRGESPEAGTPGRTAVGSSASQLSGYRNKRNIFISSKQFCGHNGKPANFTTHPPYIGTRSSMNRTSMPKHIEFFLRTPERGRGPSYISIYRFSILYIELLPYGRIRQIIIRPRRLFWSGS